MSVELFLLDDWALTANLIALIPIDGVEDDLAGRADSLDRPLGLVPAAVSPDGLEDLPDGQDDEPDADDPQQCVAVRLLGDLLQRTLLVRRTGPVAERQLQGQPTDEQVDDTVGNQAYAHAALEPRVVIHLPGLALGLVGRVDRPDLAVIAHCVGHQVLLHCDARGY